MKKTENELNEYNRKQESARFGWTIGFYGIVLVTIILLIMNLTSCFTGNSDPTEIDYYEDSTADTTSIDTIDSTAVTTDSL